MNQGKLEVVKYEGQTQGGKSEHQQLRNQWTKMDQNEQI